MTAQADLERRYRQRLAWYPRAYRRDHEEEMLAVLLAGSQPGQEFPRLAETADLVWGAVRMRLRLGEPYPGNVSRDALAIFSVVAPLLLVGPVLVTLALHLVRVPSPLGLDLRKYPALLRYYNTRVAVAHGLNLASVGLLAVAVAATLRLKRVALTVIAIILAWWTVGAGYGFKPGQPFDDLFLTCYLLEAAALIASPGPRRGLQLLTWKSGAAFAAASAVFTLSWTLTLRIAFGTCSGQGPVSCSYFTSAGSARANVAAIAVLVALAAGAALFSRPGRYLVVLFAIIFYPVALYLGQVVGAVPFWRGETMTVTLLYLPPLLAAGAVITAARRGPSQSLPNPRLGASARA